jgi:hypothetical protein
MRSDVFATTLNGFLIPLPGRRDLRGLRDWYTMLYEKLGSEYVYLYKSRGNLVVTHSSLSVSNNAKLWPTPKSCERQNARNGFTQFYYYKILLRAVSKTSFYLLSRVCIALSCLLWCVAELRNSLKSLNTSHSSISGGGQNSYFPASGKYSVFHFILL